MALLIRVHRYSNAYNWSAPLEPYTGYIEVDDFLVDIMKPQMEALFYNYSADILWCDVGGPTIFQEIGTYFCGYVPTALLCLLKVVATLSTRVVQYCEGGGKAGHL